jgi:hypothetical protein
MLICYCGKLLYKFSVNNYIMMENLYNLGIKHNTDKSYAHNFTTIYDTYFNNIRNDNINFLELGIGSNAASGPMWAEYFRNGNIYVFDIVQNYVDKINNYNITNLKDFVEM